MRKSKLEKSKGLDHKLILNLHLAALTAYENKHYLECAIINFQWIEICLLRTIEALALKLGLAKGIERMIKKDSRFSTLIDYLYLLNSDDGLSQKLKDFRNTRNKIMHELFSEKSFSSLEEELKGFVKAGSHLIIEFRKLGGNTRVAKVDL